MKTGITFTGPFSIVVDSNLRPNGDVTEAVMKVIVDALRKEEWISDEININSLQYDDDWKPTRHKTIMWSKTMSPKLKKRMVQACASAWRNIAMDMLTGQPSHSMSAEDAQEITADYVTASGWFDLTYEERHECLKLAIPRDVCI